jgi:hypothetical protein
MVNRSDTQRDGLINSLRNPTQETFAHRQLKGDRGATGVDNSIFQNRLKAIKALHHWPFLV